MSKKPTNFDFNKLKALSPEDLGVETYTFRSDMIIKGGTVVPKKSNMATMMVSTTIKKGTTVEGRKDDNNQFIFEREGGTTNSGKEYEGKVRYFFNLDEDSAPNELTTQKTVELVSKKKKSTGILVKSAVLAVSVGAGYGISKIFKIKPVYPMIVTPVVVFGILLWADHRAWNKAVGGETKNKK